MSFQLLLPNNMPEGLQDSLINGLDSISSMSDFTLDGNSINSPFQMSMPNKNPFESIFMSNNTTSNNSGNCLKILIIGLLIYLIWKCLTNSMKKEHATSQINSYGQNVNSSPVCNGWNIPEFLNVMNYNGSGLDKKDREYARCLQSGNCKSTDIQTNGGYICKDNN